jgi:chorismate synthase
MSINAVKGVELGADSTRAAARHEHRDEVTSAGFQQQRAVCWGISTGQDIVASMALKPTSSLRLPGRSLNEQVRKSK